MSPSTIAILLVLLGAVWSFIHLRLRQQPQENGLKLPPGPRPLPIVGNLIDLMGTNTHRKLYELANKYGPIMSLKLGCVPTVVVSSPQAAELFLKTHDSVFASRPRDQLSQSWGQGKGIALRVYDSYWRNIRKLCNTELLSAVKVESLAAMRKEWLEAMAQSFIEAAVAHEVVDISTKVAGLIEDLMYEMVTGHSRDQGSKFKALFDEGLRLVGTYNIADYMPYLRALDLQGLARQMKAFNKLSDDLLEKIIDEHEQDAKVQKGNQQNFIHVLLSLMNESTTTNAKSSYQLDRSNIKAILQDMLAAGIETSSTTIEWTFSELLRHPRVMKKLQGELENVVGMDRRIEETDLGKLVYLDMVVKESLRLHPPAPTLIPHESMEDIVINGYYIAKNSRIIINNWAIERDPNTWSNNAEEFFPERFIDNDIDLKGQHFQLIPFGSGRRRCPGMHLGLTFVKLVVAQLVHCFSWELPNGMSPGDLDMDEKCGLSLSRVNHLFAKPTYRLLVKD